MESASPAAVAAAEQYNVHVGPIVAPFVTALVDRTGVRPGVAVLDVACGTGFVAQAAADRVAPEDRVVGIDVSAGMLAVAKRRSRPGAGFEWYQASADQLPVPDGTFDVALCQQGAQFFPDLDAALVELERVLRPGGCLAATVWAGMDRSPFMQAQYLVSCDILGEDAVAPFLSAFGLGANRLREAATGAGLVDVTVEELEVAITLPEFPRYAVDQLQAVPWGAEIAGRGPDALEKAAEAITARLHDFRGADGVVTVPFTSLMLLARRAG
jgi:SAM-dependent methyltransferase